MVTQPLGNEPHNVKLAPEGHLLDVADEDGRALIVADPATLEELNPLELPAKPHDLAVDAVGSVWIPLLGDDRFGRFQSGTMELLPTGRPPHDLIAAPMVGSGSRTGTVMSPPSITQSPDPWRRQLPAWWSRTTPPSVRGRYLGVGQHGGSAVVGFVDGRPTTVPVGPVPHHIAFGDDIAIMAMSGPGQAVFIDGSGVIGRFDLLEGLHGAAVARLP